ncbi:polyadenylate-binding protein 1-like [Cloeon dipterum]|uniref:polyadenylate-binding protein 1-like n=1 Tax=Cloeon dipterum TaxID=197152 RepID=UPI00321FC0EE
MSSLYVGNLHPDVTEAVLYNTFRVAGQINTIRVVRDKISGRSLCYAYVNFNSPAEAERALDDLNYDLLLGEVMRIMKAQPSCSRLNWIDNNVFINHLNKTINTKELHNTFSAFGKILSCKLKTDEAGNSLGYGYVQFETEEAAKTAIKKVNGMLLEDQKVYVGKFIPRKERCKDANIFTNVYIKNLSDDITDDKLHQMFEKFGRITSHKVMVSESGKSKGFGFVAFEEHAAAKNACEEFNGKPDNRKVLYCGPAESKSFRQKGLSMRSKELRTRGKDSNLYIKNLDKTINDAQLKSLFESFGEILSVKVMLDANTGRSRGFGFVCFTSPEAATEAIKNVNGQMVLSKPLYVSLAQSKEKRLAVLRAQFMSSLMHSQPPQFYRNQVAQNWPQPQSQWTSGEMPHPCVPGQPTYYLGLSNPQNHYLVRPHYSPVPMTDIGMHPPCSTQIPQPATVGTPSPKVRPSSQAASSRNLASYPPHNYPQKQQGTHQKNKKLSRPANSDHSRAAPNMPGGVANRSTNLGHPIEQQQPHTPSYYNIIKEPTNYGYPLMHTVMAHNVPVGWTTSSHTQTSVSRVQPPLSPATLNRQGARAALNPEDGAVSKQKWSTGTTTSEQSPQDHAAMQPQVQNHGLPTVTAFLDQQEAAACTPESCLTATDLNCSSQGLTNGTDSTNSAHLLDENKDTMTNNTSATQQHGVLATEPALTAAMLEGVSVEERRNMIGNRMFHLIHNMYPQSASKITGMLLEIDNAELLHMLNNHENLKIKAEEAFMVLTAFEASKDSKQTIQHNGK